MGARIPRRGIALVWFGALAIGFALRAFPLTAAKPYIAYIDEGNFLHPAFLLVRDGGWDPRSYLYPQFPPMAVVAAARAFDPLYRWTSGASLRDQIPARVELYDDLEPFPLLFLARCLSVALGLAIVTLSGLLARRLAGPPAGAAAALLAALVPALVLRGSIAIVDPYAAFFVLACAYLTDRMRTSPRPGLTSFAAGAMAGVAFASKYPAALVMIAFGVTALLQPVGFFEKARRLALGALGLVLGAVAAMPAVVTRTAEVYEAIRTQASRYGQMPSPPLWRQALQRAEWDIPYERPELGFAFLAFALAGLVVGLRDRKISSTLWGWSAFAAACLLLYSSRTFQPFRNLLPLVPLGCILVSVVFVRARQWVRSPRWVDVVAILWVLLAFAVPLSRYARARRDLVDSRKLAMDWLVQHARPTDRVLLVRELVFLNQERARLQAKQTVRGWKDVEAEVRSARPRFVVAGVIERLDGPSVEVAALPAIRGDYQERLRFGGRSTVAFEGWWRGNDQLVCLLERLDR